MSFGEKILKYREDIINDLSQLIEIKSYANNNNEDKKALLWILKKAEQMGFNTTNVKNVAGHAEYGNGNELAAVIAHVDVVQASGNWQTNPFKLTKKDNKLFGRGVVDNKGAAIIALYCLKVLKDENIKGVRRLRTIFGCQEEIGMPDMKTYFAEQSIPDMAFTPDLSYGICNMEKGILQIEISSDFHDGTILNEFHSGVALNIVPDEAFAFINCNENEDHQLQRLAYAKKGNYTFDYTKDGIKITSKGTPAHSAELENGFNAATHLIRLLSSNFSHKVLGKLCSFIDSTIGLEIHGASMGIKEQNSMFGDLTLNVGEIQIDSTHSFAKIDIRYPITLKGDEIFNTIKERAENENLKIKILHHDEPLNVDKNSFLVSLLNNSYNEIMGEPANLYCAGGTTYSKTLPGKCVAFGPAFCSDKTNIHNANENISIDNLFKHAQICLEAMYKMLTTKN